MSAMDYSKVAHLYDIYAKTDLDVPFFLKETKGCGKVLELMSGTGRLSIPLIEAGVPLTCVDNSPEMLTLFRKKLEKKSLSAAIYEMDVCELSLPEQFDLIIIPFHAFAEILGSADQYKALAGIRKFLAKNGRFICTLHNPSVRLKSVTQQLVQQGKYPLPDNQGSLFLWITQEYDAATHIVTGTQFYEVYDAKGVMRSKSFVDIQFCLHEKEDFEKLVQSEGFSLLGLYGDYAYAEFQEDKSPFMIWILGTGEML